MGGDAAVTDSVRSSEGKARGLEGIRARLSGGSGVLPDPAPVACCGVATGHGAAATLPGNLLGVVRDVFCKNGKFRKRWVKLAHSILSGCGMGGIGMVAWLAVHGLRLERDGRSIPRHASDGTIGRSARRDRTFDDADIYPVDPGASRRAVGQAAARNALGFRGRVLAGDWHVWLRQGTDC